MEKKIMVEKIKEMLKEAKGIYFLDYHGIKAEELNTLRKRMKTSGFYFLIVKNRLAALAFREYGFLNQASPFLKGSTSLIISKKDEVAPAHLLKNLQKDFSIKFKGAILGEEVFAHTQFDFLANIPPREELFSHLLSAILSPITKLTSILESLLNDLVITIEEISKKKNP